MKNVQDVVARIENLCNDRNLTVNTMLKNSGLHSNVINSMRSRNSMPSAETLSLIAKTLQVSTDYLLRGMPDTMRDVISYLGESLYTIKHIDGEDCVCRKIEKYEIELSGCHRKRISVDLYLWELSDKGEPLQIIGYKHDIKTKSELKDKIDYIADNINNIESVVDNGFFSHNTQSFTTGDVTNNSGVIGQINAPTTIKNENDVALSTQENDLLQIYREADGKTQMKIMQFIYSLEKEE